MFTIPDNLGTSRALALGAVLGSAAAFAASGRAPPSRTAVSATAVAVAGLLVLVVDHDAAIEPATSQYGERFNGWGNPNAAATLEALALPLALAAAIAAAGAGALGWWAIVALLALDLRVCLPRRDRRGRRLLVTVLALTRPQRPVPQERSRRCGRARRLSRAGPGPASSPPLPADRKLQPPPRAESVRRPAARPLQDDIGRTSVGVRRTFFGSGGARRRCRRRRTGAERPLVGYGFGFRSVFADRYAAVFNAQRPRMRTSARRCRSISSVSPRRLDRAAGAALRPTTFPRPPCSWQVAGLVVGLTQSFVLAAGSPRLRRSGSAPAMTAAAANATNAK